MDALDVLMDMRALIEKGWCKGTLWVVQPLDDKDYFSQENESNQLERFRSTIVSRCELGALNESLPLHVRVEWGVNDQIPQLAREVLVALVESGKLVQWHDDNCRNVPWDECIFLNDGKPMYGKVDERYYRTNSTGEISDLFLTHMVTHYNDWEHRTQQEMLELTDLAMAWELDRQANAKLSV